MARGLLRLCGCIRARTAGQWDSALAASSPPGLPRTTGRNAAPDGAGETTVACTRHDPRLPRGTAGGAPHALLDVARDVADTNDSASGASAAQRPRGADMCQRPARQRSAVVGQGDASTDSGDNDRHALAHPRMAQSDYAIRNALLAPLERERGSDATAPCFVLLNSADGMCDGPSWTAVARICGWIHVLEPACCLRSDTERARESFGTNHNSCLVDIVLARLRVATGMPPASAHRRELRQNMSDNTTCNAGFRQVGRHWSAAAILHNIFALQWNNS